MDKDELIRKVTSRKFLVFLAAFFTSLGAGLTGCVDAGTSLTSVVVSAIGYGISEALPDLGGALANQSQTIDAKNVSVTATDKGTVAAILAPEPTEQGGE